MMQLYYAPPSAPCRAVMLFMHAINLQADMKMIDFSKGEHMTPEYLAMNPQHTIPVIEDNGFVLSESRAILGYLAEKYAKDSTYYPSDPMARGVVNQRLMFDIGTLYQRFLETYMIPMMSGKGKMNEMAFAKLQEALGWLNTFMGDAPYMAGDKITIADFSIMATISTLDGLGVDMSPYPRVLKWYMKCMKEMKDYEEGNGIGAKMLADMLKQGLGM